LSARALVVALCAAGAGTAWSACDRKANIFDEPMTMVRPTPTGTLLDAGLTPIDADFSDPGLPACAERPEAGECRGANDFPCDLEGLVAAVVRECQPASDCSTNGWLAVELGADGCAALLEMSEPEPRFADCASARLAAVSCPCGKTRTQIFLGLGNAGCPDAGPRPCRSGEFACDAGEVCRNGVCVAVGNVGAGGADAG
jgi:hypothetical protein